MRGTFVLAAAEYFSRNGAAFHVRCAGFLTRRHIVCPQKNDKKLRKTWRSQGTLACKHVERAPHSGRLMSAF